ncbi:hypothetical protein PHYC_00806 [Phycisphaerales bacterium]|nr:hypothetical protein PHYC_00806 [Phycisphaerales bacterium]
MHLETGRVDRAKAALRAHLARSASDHAALKLLAEVHFRSGERPQALFALERAGRSGDPEAWYLLGRELQRDRAWERASDAFAKSVAIKPGEPTAWGELADCRIELDDEAGARDALEQARKHSPGHPDTARQCVRVMLRLGAQGEALAAAREAAARFGEDPLALHTAVYAMNSLAGVDEAELAALHRQLGLVTSRSEGPAREAASFPNGRDAGRPLRVAMLSCDFRRHSCAYFLLGVMPRLREHGVEVYLYSTGAEADDFTARFRGMGEWRECGRMGALRLAELASHDAIDVMVDLAGWTAPGHMRALARRLAPVQIAYLGYPNTTGIPAMDARIVDADTDPPEAESFATERLVRLARPFVCFTPEDGWPRPSVRASGAPMAFGSFNAGSKLTAEVMRTWAAVLAACPGSRLLLKRHSLTEPALRRHRDVLRSTGVDPVRLEVLPFAASSAEHLAMYANVDIALDPFPYHGTTTTCEALWMGVPVVTLAGSGHRTRVGVSLLRGVGRGSWTADSPEAYVGIATHLAAAREGMQAERAALRPAMENSPLRDEAGMAAALAGAIRSLWTEFVREGRVVR